VENDGKSNNAKMAASLWHKVVVNTALIVRKTMSLATAHVYTVHGVFSIMIRTPLSV